MRFEINILKFIESNTSNFPYITISTENISKNLNIELIYVRFILNKLSKEGKIKSVNNEWIRI